MQDDRGETAWGAWVRTQPKGVLTRAMRETKLSWSSVSKAKHHLVTRDVAEALAKFTRGAVKARELVKRRAAA
jgi:hypothetical protein